MGVEDLDSGPVQTVAQRVAQRAYLLLGARQRVGEAFQLRVDLARSDGPPLRTVPDQPVQTLDPPDRDTGRNGKRLDALRCGHDQPNSLKPEEK